MVYGTFSALLIGAALTPLGALALKSLAVPKPPWLEVDIFGWTFTADFILTLAGLVVALLSIALFRFDRMSVGLAALLIATVAGLAVTSIVYFEANTRAIVSYSQSTAAAVIVMALALLVQFFLVRCLWSVIKVVRDRRQASVAVPQARGSLRLFSFFTLPVHFARLPTLRKIVVSILGLFTIYLFSMCMSRWANLTTNVVVVTEATIVGAVNGCLGGANSPAQVAACRQIDEALRNNIVIAMFVINLAAPFLFLALARIGRLLQELASRTNIDVATKSDQRAPVLYLRPFGMESVKVKQAKRDPLDWLFDVTNRQQRLDQIVLDEMTAVGPVIGLGNPKDTWQPIGIAREYAPDANWKERISNFIRSAKRIVLTLADTPHMQFEIDEIVRLQRISDTLFLLPPGLPLAKAEELIAGIETRLASAPTSTRSLEGGSPVAFWFAASGKMHMCVSRSFSSDAYRAAFRTFENLHGSEAVDAPLPAVAPGFA